MSTGEIKPSGLHVPGFQHLGWLLPQHIDLVPELYFLFISLMMGQPVKLLPTDSKVGANFCNFSFGKFIFLPACVNYCVVYCTILVLIIL